MIVRDFNLFFGLILVLELLVIYFVQVIIRVFVFLLKKLPRSILILILLILRCELLALKRMIQQRRCEDPFFLLVVFQDAALLVVFACLAGLVIPQQLLQILDLLVHFKDLLLFRLIHIVFEHLELFTVHEEPDLFLLEFIWLA